MAKFAIILAAFVVAATMLVMPKVDFATDLNASETTIMQFGRPDLGSGCNFPCEDDASFHAIDAIEPGAVRISAGDEVWFDVEGFHQVAIYEPGTKPRDIEPNASSFPFANDEEGRIGIGAPTVDFDFTFSEPGKYLVICNITPHLEESQMWGWVVVN